MDAEPRLHNAQSVRNPSDFSPLIMGEPGMDSHIDNSADHTTTEFNDQDAFSILRDIKLANVNRPVIAHLNINSIRNKFVPLKLIIGKNIDILLISETKLDNTFTEPQFIIDGYSPPIRADKNGDSGGLLLYVRDHILCKEIKYNRNINSNITAIEGILLEINLRNTKWVIFGGYNSHKKNIGSYLGILGQILESLMSKYENFLIIGDLNSEVREQEMHDFCSSFNLQNLVKDPTCFKNPLNPSSIDVMLTNRPNSFLKTTTVETGLSDHHKMTVSVLRSYVNKQAPTCIMYRDYKTYDSQSFDNILYYTLSTIDRGDMNQELFQESVMNLLNTHAPLKKKFVRANNGPFMTKTLSKAFMKRSRLKNIYLKSPTVINGNIFKKHRNYCVNLLKREKRNYYNNLNTKLITDNKKFWKTVKPLFSEKHITSLKFTLVESDTIISDDSKVAETFNSHFENVTANLDIRGFTTCPGICYGQDKIMGAIEKFKNHPSIIKINEKINIRTRFSFHLTDTASIASLISNLDTKKPTTFGSIPPKIISEHRNTLAPFICKMFNDSILHCEFPDPLKRADITPGHKKLNRTDKDNYRPVSILPCISKIYERTMEDQIYIYIRPYLSNYLCGFRKGYSAQNCLLAMTELWNKALDRQDLAGALLTDLSKAFDCLNHELMIAKLNAYGFDYNSLAYVFSYLTGRKHRTKVNNYLSSWADILSGIAQGSILGPLLFNIYINDIFLFIDETRLANYADDNTPFSIESDINTLLNTLNIDVSILVNWFTDNYFKMNPDKCKLLVTNHGSDVSLDIDGEIITGSNYVKLLGVTIDNKLEFNEHVSKICTKVSTKLHALARISQFMQTENIRNIMKAFIESQFGYCPLVWMFHSRTLNNRINRLHERALRITYKNTNLSFNELLEIDNSVNIHHRNLQKLAIEMYKVIHGLAPGLMNDIFKISSNQFNLRHNTFKSSNVRTVTHGTETIAFRGARLWHIIPPEIKKTNSLSTFKYNIKCWKPEGCLCRLCKIYIPSLGFLS